MKIIALNGSPRPIGNTSNILNDVQDMFEREGVETRGRAWRWRSSTSTSTAS